MNRATTTGHQIKFLLVSFSIILAFTGCGPSTPNSEGTGGSAAPVELQALPLEGVLAKIEAQRGSIVVVDTWATWCGPCVREFPELVNIHRAYAKDGVVCMSVSLDRAKDQEKALAFLQTKGASFPNFMVEDTRSWLAKWNIKGIPVVLVFGRDGKLLRKFDRDGPDRPFEYADVDRLVGDLVRQGK